MQQQEINQLLAGLCNQFQQKINAALAVHDITIQIREINFSVQKAGESMLDTSTVSSCKPNGDGQMVCN